MGHNSRYFYCKVTSTIEGVSVSATSNKVKLIVEKANYSTVKSGTTTFYNTLQQAFNGATSGGGDTGGGTITVINNVTDTSIGSTNKTIKIDTNGKTITRKNYIETTGGTLTIGGGGTILNNNSAGVSVVKGNGGNITIGESVTFQSEKNTINATTGNLIIYSGYFYGKAGGPVMAYGGNYKSGSVTIKNATIYAPRMNTHAIEFSRGIYNATMTSVKVGNASTNTLSSFTDNKTPFATIANRNGGVTTINGNSKIYAGPYGASAIAKYNGGTLNLKENTSIYATNEGNSISRDGSGCVSMHEGGTSIDFDSTGRFFAGSYVAQTLNGVDASYKVTKGHFATLSNKYMFFRNNKPVETNYIGTTSTQTYEWMDNLTTTKTKPLSCYYYKKGV